MTNNDSRIFPKSIFVRLQNHAEASSINPDNIVGISTDDFPFQLAMQPLVNLYLYDKYNTQSLEKGNLQLIMIFIGIAIVVLILAILNYINLSLSRVMTRYKEIGLKKTIGATWNKLFAQVLFESILIVLLSFFFAIVITEITSPLMASFYGKEIPTSYVRFPDLIIILSVPVLLGLIAGIYPAIVFSIYTPRKILSGLRINYSGKNPFMHFLTVFQFAIAIILISITFVMFMQIDFVKHKDLGFDEELLLRTIAVRDANRNSDFYVNAINEHSGVLGTTVSSGTPGMVGRHVVNNDSEGKMVAEISIDTNFFKVFNIEIISGRKLLPGDNGKVAYMNEKALEVLEWKSFIGKSFEDKEIIGIVENFHTGSLYNDYEPMFLALDQKSAYQLTIRLDGSKLSETMAYIEDQFNKTNTPYPFYYEFYDDYFDNMYKKEERLSKLLSTFSILAIIISCLGIIGMVEFTSIKKTKEIGIRKSLGAWSFDIIKLLTNSYLIIFALAIVIGIPVSWIISEKWLASFVFKVDLALHHFLLSGGIIAAIAIIMISYQTIKAALNNPVEALRYE